MRVSFCHAKSQRTIPALASCQEKVPQGWVTTPDGVTGSEQPSQSEQAPIDESKAKPMPMPSIDGPPVKPDPRDTKIKHPGLPGSRDGSAGEGRRGVKQKGTKLLLLLNRRLCYQSSPLGRC